MVWIEISAFLDCVFVHFGVRSSSDLDYTMWAIVESWFIM